jgi:hypothetical protein
MPTAVPTAAVLTDADALRDARGYMATIEGGPTRIRSFMRGAQNGPLRMSCVAQRLQEAQVHVVLARDEMKVLAAAAPETASKHGRDSDREHALRRLSLMAQRTQEVERAARLCIDDELSTVNATKFHTDVPAEIERRGDPTEPPAPPHPCPDTPCTVFPWVQ